MAKYTAHQGKRVGISDDEIVIRSEGAYTGTRASSPSEDAMQQALGWAAESNWPDGDYVAVVWLEDENGEVVVVEEVDIKDGRME